MTKPQEFSQLEDNGVGDGYLPRRFFTQSIIEDVPEGGMHLARARKGWPGHDVWEALPKADLDALRELARAVELFAKPVGMGRDEDWDALAAAHAALSPAFLETLEKP